MLALLTNDGVSVSPTEAPFFICMIAVFKEPISRIDEDGLKYHCSQIEFVEYHKVEIFDAIDFKLTNGAEVEHWVIPIHNIAAIIC